MDFRSQIVINRKNKKARIAYVGLFICVFSITAGYLPNGEDYIGYVFMAGIVIVIIGALIARGDITVQGFAGMYIRPRKSSDGMDNRIYFTAGTEKISTRFYLDGPQHLQMLGLLFDEFYRLHLPFIERNMSTRTYMFEVLSSKALEEFKKKYGY